MSKTSAPWYALSERAGIPLVTEHPSLVGSGLTLRQVRRAISLGNLIATRLGLYTLVSFDAVVVWVENSRSTVSK